MKFAFLGTPEFASRVLCQLVDLGRIPTLVVSQPDRPRGRGQKLTPPVVVLEAERLGLVCKQYADINHPAVLEELEAFKVDTLVVAAFGQILRGELLRRFLCINVHASLLPAYRGAAPIERALLAGEEETGVSIMRMVEELDAGPVALRRSCSITPCDDAGSLVRLLATMGAVGVDEVLALIEGGRVEWLPQKGLVTYAPRLSARDLWLDPRKSAQQLYNQVRGLCPYHGARTAVSCQQGDILVLKVWRAWVEKSLCNDTNRPVGTLFTQGEHIFLVCGQGVLELLVVQPAGRPRMTAGEFVRGYWNKLKPSPRCFVPGEND